jgi:hypothetical protein
LSHSQPEAPEASYFGVDAELVIKTVSIVLEEPRLASTPNYSSYLHLFPFHQMHANRRKLEAFGTFFYFIHDNRIHSQIE